MTSRLNLVDFVKGKAAAKSLDLCSSDINIIDILNTIRRNFSTTSLARGETSPYGRMVHNSQLSMRDGRLFARGAEVEIISQPILLSKASALNLELSHSSSRER